MRSWRSGLTIVLIPEEGGASRSIHLAGRRVRVLFGVAAILCASFVIMGSSWVFLGIAAGKGWALRATVDSLQAERAQLQELTERLEQAEEEYERLRLLFGPSSPPVAPDLWLPPSGLPGSQRVTNAAPEAGQRPTSWPLTEEGYLTQALVEGGAGDHPGIDIAVPTGSYVRASAGGRVVRLGEDPLYGLFLVLDHGDGYQTVYAHTSMLLVERGQTVRRNEVIALTGSTGRSTAAHLHFEILLDGIPLDPLSLVEEPG